MRLKTRRRVTDQAAAADGVGQDVHALTSLHEQLLEAAPDGAIRDATGRIETERALQVSEELWRMSLDGVLEGFALYRCVREAGSIVDFELSYINPAGAQTFGRSVSEVIGARILMLVPPVVQARGFAELVDIVETGQRNGNLQYGHADGIVQGGFNSRSWKFGDGIAVTWRDVTEHEHALAKLRASEQRFRASVQYLHDSLSVFSAVRDGRGGIVDFRWDYANDVSSAITGYSSAALEGRSLLEVLPDHGPSGMLEVYIDVVETGEPWVQPDLWYEDVWGDGQRQRRCFDVRATKLGDGFVVVTRDVTAQREEAQALEAARLKVEHANAELQVANETIRGFTAIAAHDLRSPITSILGFSTLLSEEWETTSEQNRRKFVATIQRQSQNLSMLVDDLLDSASIENGAMTTSPEPVILRAAIDQCVALSNQVAGVTVSCSPELVVRVDAGHLARILNNFVGNAFKYGEPPVRIEAARIEAGGRDCGAAGMIEVRVIDSGPGVPADFLSRLFGKFARADTPATRSQRGTGIGLSIVRGLAEINGGQARYEPNLPRGSCFVVKLPEGAS